MQGRTRMLASTALKLAASLLLAAPAVAQTAPAFPSPLDPGRNVQPLVHTPLPEQYIWTAGDATFLRADRGKYSQLNADLRTAPHRFRRTFRLDRVPAHATLYLAGPRSATVWLNGRRLASFASDPGGPINFRVFHLDVTHALRPGVNTLALEVVRGRGVVSAEAIRELAQLGYGEVLAVKLLAAPFGHDGKDLVHSDTQWTSTVASEPASGPVAPAWTAPAATLDWKPVDSLGGIESSRNFLQWGVDAGMYGWPGYMGISAPLGTVTLTPAAVTHVFESTAHFDHLDSLTSADPAAPAFTITREARTPTDLESPALLIDFGRELAGRVLVDNLSAQDATLSIAYGESELEALATGLTSQQRGGNYVGTNLLDVPATGAARGPKSAFRYVRVRFLRGAPTMRLRFRAEAITYPVSFAGSFESSDPLLNRIWETGAYTAHLCMQDDLWDAPKRDRGRWAGDMDVEGRVISTAFGESAELERTLAELAKTVTPTHHINGIPGYSALWITTLASLYAHAGDLDYLKTQHDALLRVLAAIDHSIDPAAGLYAPGKGSWGFIDWAPGLYGPAPAVLPGTDLQYIRGYRAAATLLRALGDTENATHADSAAQSLIAHLRAALAQQPGLFGNSPQIAALTLTSGFASSLPPDTYDLPHIRQSAPSDPAITPYLNMTVLDALSLSGHQPEALAWIRTYWGGMLAQGATSFWENYDLRWPKDANYPLSLQADGSSGYFTSFAHGWSAGPTAWLSENVLGVRDAADGFRSVTIAPRLLGLTFARGTVPTPHGVITVDARKENAAEHIDITLPEGVEHATLSMPAEGTLTVDGQPVQTAANAGERRLPLSGAGRHTVILSPVAP